MYLEKNEALYIQQRIFPYSRGLFSTVSLTLETERSGGWEAATEESLHQWTALKKV